MAHVICSKCNVEATWIDCWNSCDDGYFDGYEEDPLWYDDGDLVPCSVCYGRGGWWGCTNKDCPPDAPVSHVTYDLRKESERDA